MTASIDTADLTRIARAAGQSGKPEPDFAKADPKAHAAYRAGAGLPDDIIPEPPAAPPQTTPAGTGGTRTPGTRSQTGRGGSSGRSGSRKPRARKSGRTGRRSSVGGKLSRATGIGGGTGGGLLLAVFAYPIGVAILQNGPSGATDWLKAKFLNKVPAVPVKGQDTDPNKPYYVDPKAKPGQPGSGKWPDGRPIPGQPQPAPQTPGSTNE